MEQRDERLTALEAAVKSAESKLKNAEIDVMAIQNKLKSNEDSFIQQISDKSFIVKREICNVFLATDDDIVICDPEDEYYPLVQEFGGQLIELSTSSKGYINLMDIESKLMTAKPLESEI